MKILITGAFGNVGTAVVDACLARGHQVSVFEMRNRANEKKARKYGGRLRNLYWGDIRNPGEVKTAVAGQDVVIHLAAIIPPLSDKNPRLCFEVNVGGTRNIISAIKESGLATRLVFVSSVSVMGPTQDKTPPLRVTDPVNPTDNYTRSKVEAEQLLSLCGLPYCILRLGAVMPSRFSFSLNMIKELEVLFEIPPQARCEVILDLDVATALITAAESMNADESALRKTFFLGGGKAQGCQMKASEMVRGLFGAIGLPIPAPYLFNQEINNYYLDWLDTDEAEQTLHFQNHAFSGYLQMVRKRYLPFRPLFWLLGPIIGRFIATKSPFLIKSNRKSDGVSPIA